MLPLLAKKASSPSHISGASRVGLLTWQRRPRATRTTTHLEPAIHPHLHDRLRPAQLGVRHPHLLTLRLGFHASATLSRSGWLIEPAITELAVMLVLRTSQPLCQSHPGPALLLSSIAAITITLPYSPLTGPLSLTAVPAWILAALAGLTAFYVIANEGAKPRYPLTTRSQTPRRPWPWMSSSPAHHAARCHLGLPAWQAASCGRDAGKSSRPPCRSSRAARTSSSAGGSVSA